MSSANSKDALQSLLRSDLDFANANTQYSAHSLHAFAAKFPPQLPHVFISELTKPGDTVLDPMMGSGTAILEAQLLRRKALGFDIDPLAVRICNVKTTSLDVLEITSTVDETVAVANRLSENPEKMHEAILARYSGETIDFFNYWFTKETQAELMALVLATEAHPHPPTKRFLEVIFSSIIVTKSGGVSLARDLAHSRPHKVYDKNQRSAIEKFAEKAEKAIAQVSNLPAGSKRPLASYGDARRLPLRDKSVDLIVTSPPYVNAIDYVRAHKFSLAWLGYPIKQLSLKKREYIGAEKYNGEKDGHLAAKVQDVLRHLEGKDPKKSRIARKYFVDMKSALGEMCRVLKPRKPAIIVVGTSTIRGMSVETHLCLAHLAQQVGFDVVDISERNLDRNKRMMPARFGKKESLIEFRMHNEYVIGLTKGDKCPPAYK